VNSLIDTLKFVNEQSNLAAFTGSILGIIPFRDRWVGNTQTVDSRENIAAMAELFPDLTIFPSIKESEQLVKNAIACHYLPQQVMASAFQEGKITREAIAKKITFQCTRSQRLFPSIGG
jgi:hypothetical protein